MNSLAAIRTTPPRRAVAPGVAQRCSYVEDLNWHAAWPRPAKKAPRRPEMWVPGPNGQWEGVTPTLQ
jgi:hypothetical protein